MELPDILIISISGFFYKNIRTLPALSGTIWDFLFEI